MLVVVVTINAVNFVDGLDGLAAGIVGIAAVAFFAYSYLLARAYDPNVFSAASLITAALDRLLRRLPAAQLQPGPDLHGRLRVDAARSAARRRRPSPSPATSTRPTSRSCGSASYVPILLPIAVLLLPSLDLVLAVIRRTRAGLKWWQPDTLHLHHRLLAIGHSHAHAVLIMYLWTAILTFGAASFAFVPARTALATIVGAGVVAALLTAGLPWLQRRGARQ